MNEWIQVVGVCLQVATHADCSASWGVGGGEWGRRTSQVHVRGHPGGKLGMLCCWSAGCLHLRSGQQLCPNLIIIPSYGRHMLWSHLKHPICLQPFVSCIARRCTALHSPPALWPRRSTQQNWTLLTARPLSFVLPLPCPLSLLFLVAKVLERQAGVALQNVRVKWLGIQPNI